MASRPAAYQQPLPSQSSGHLPAIPLAVVLASLAFTAYALMRDSKK